MTTGLFNHFWVPRGRSRRPTVAERVTEDLRDLGLMPEERPAHAEALSQLPCHWCGEDASAWSVPVVLRLAEGAETVCARVPACPEHKDGPHD